MAGSTMDTATFDSLRTLIYDKAGIKLSDNKSALVAARVGKRMRELGIEDHHEYLDYLLKDENSGELVSFLDVISTNVTSFFRESAHFDILAGLIDEWIANGANRLRFWSAASSTGEEPYTMAMVILERLQRRNVDVKILATDLSTRVLEKCAEGIYPAEKTAPIPPAMLHTYFEERKGVRESEFAAKQELKNLINFSRINLSKTPFPMTGPFDAVFCRNVMIYFDNTVRKNLLTEIYRLLKHGGYLFVGHAESLTGILSGFKAVRPSVYIKP
jgi:chemotaxis protein methyltransferase CheR